MSQPVFSAGMAGAMQGIMPEHISSQTEFCPLQGHGEQHPGAGGCRGKREII